MRVGVALVMFAGCSHAAPPSADPGPRERGPEARPSIERAAPAEPSTSSTDEAPIHVAPPEPSPGLSPLFESEVAWEKVPRTGLEEAVPNRELVPFGRWPDPAFVLAMFQQEYGLYEPRIFRFDVPRQRWVPLGFKGDFRAGIEVTRISPTRWLMIRRGFGVGAHVLIQVGLVGPGLTTFPHAELPCRSADTRLVLGAPDGIAGGWSLFCVRRDDVSKHLLHFGPDDVTPAM
ncbi:MAG: hypothetical protein RIF41_05955 [Polyangiaceae bacterium]